MTAPQPIEPLPEAIWADLDAHVGSARPRTVGELAEILHRWGWQRDPVARRLLDMEPALRQAQARLLEYENAISWDTACLHCSRVLDSAYEATVRAEKAERQLAAALRIVETLQRLQTQAQTLEHRKLLGALASDKLLGTQQYDPEADAAYLPIWPLPDQIGQTITVTPAQDLLVDLLPDGRLAGVERVGGRIEAKDLWAVLRWVRQQPTPKVEADPPAAFLDAHDLAAINQHEEVADGET